MSSQVNPERIANRMGMLKREISKSLRGCDGALEVVIRSMLAGGHAELLGVPGTGKSLLAKLLAKCLGMKASVFTFLPDMMPGDIVGTEIFNPVNRQMEPLPGKIDPESQIIVGDEYNRAPPKTVNAAIEVMQDGILHIGRQRISMNRPFFILVRNPIEQSGTYATPEAVLDRLAASATLNYPPFEEAVKLAADRNVIQQDPIKAAGIVEVLKAEEVHAYQDFVRDEVQMPEAVARYIARLVYATHPPEDKDVGDDGVDFSLYEKYMPDGYKNDKLIYVGDSNRGIIWLAALARANAVMAGRTVVIDQDVKDVAVSVLAHRLTLNDQKSHKYPRHVGRMIIRELLDRVDTIG